MPDKNGNGVVSEPALELAASEAEGAVKVLPPQQTPLRSSPVQYDPEIETAIDRISAAIAANPTLNSRYPPRWLAIQLLEGDEAFQAEVAQIADDGPIQEIVQDRRLALEARYGEEIEILMADQRYNLANRLVRQVISYPGEQAITRTDRLDRITTHPLLGLPLFLGLMWIVFKFTTDVANPYLEWIDALVHGPLTRWVVALFTLVGLGESWLQSLFVDGIIAGVGGVMTFVPVLMSLYLILAVLEDSGYMARAAFVMDRLMSKLGLQGKSFLPMVVGFGCTVPAIYATRTLDDERDRILTGLLVPFMSCGARLPVYILFAAIFFPQYAGLVIFGLYLLGILTALGVGLLLRRTLFRGKEQSSFVMELPPYRLPTLRNIWRQTWQRTAAFIHNAWTIILAASICIWLLTAIPIRGGGTFANTPMEDSAFAGLAGWLAPALEPLGFGNWESSGALIGGLAAKEVVISTLAQIYHLDDPEETVTPTNFGQDLAKIGGSFLAATGDTLRAIPLVVGIDLFPAETEPEPTTLMTTIRRSFEAASNGHGALAGLAFMVFVLLYTPCMATVAAARQELGARWMWVSVIGQTVVAWLGAFIVYQGGLLLGLG